MSDLLIQFLLPRITPELMNVYLRASQLIEYFEKDDIYELIDGMLIDIDNSDTHITLDRIYYIHKEQLVTIITEYGITLSDDISLLDLIIVIEALIYLEDYEDKDTLFNILSTDEDNLIKLTDVLEVVSVNDALYYSNLITKVSGQFIAKLYSICEKERKEILSTDEELIKNKEITKKLKELKDNALYNRSFVFDLIRNGLSLNLPIYIYINLFKDNLFNDLPDEEVAVNLAMFGLISSDTDYYNLLKDILPNYITDLNDVSTLLSLTRKYHIGV